MRIATLFLALIWGTSALADNQTNQLSPVQSPSGLPFSITIEQTNLQLPIGIHSGVFGVYKGQWVLIAGRTNGLHGFDPTNNFPVSAQNTRIYVINPATGSIASRSLADPSSGLSQEQIDTLSVTSPEGYQENNTLYMVGGYGINTHSGAFETKSVLTAIYLPGIVNWVTQPNNPNNSVATNIRQISNPIFQVAGGKMFNVNGTALLVFGQNFSGEYTDSGNGIYTKQVRKFKIIDNNQQLSVQILPALPLDTNPSFRRRDLNVAPVLLNNNNLLQYGLVAYAGVFTESSGVWTVPVVIDGAGNPTMANPNDASTFAQAMNHYECATANLYSKKYTNMYTIFFGGMSYGFYSGGTFQTDSEVPFINQVTTIQMDRNKHFTQYLMDNQYPTILSTGSNPGNTLLFGSDAYFIPANILQYNNGIISLDALRQPTVIGYIVGGIASTLANTNTQADSFASTYIFKVTLTPNLS